MQKLVASSALVAALAALPAQVYVSPSGSDLGAGTAASPFLTINHAASVAASGGTIHLLPGIYGDEQDIVQLGAKDLVLQGDGMATTTLRPHSSATAMLVPANPVSSAILPHRVGVLVQGSVRIHLRDLTIDAQQVVPASGHLAGLYLSAGADVTCDHVAVENCRPLTFGAGSAHAVVVRGDVPTVPTRLVARDAHFTAFGDAAIRAVLRAEVDLRECRIAGVGTASGVVDQVGVWLQSDAVGSVRLSRIADCGGPAGAAVRLDNPGTGCVVEGNRIARAAFGVDLRHTPPALVPGSVRHNRIAAVDTTVRVRGVSGLLIAGNSLFPVSRLDPNPYLDDTAAGNSWQGNRYAIAPGTASVAIPGGGNVDLAPRPGLSELRGLQRVACGGAPVSVVVADFDGDDHDDFATLDLRPIGVGITVGLWRPGGHVVVASSFGAADLQPVELVVGEFDGQPGPDLVALTAPLPPAVTGAALWVLSNDGAGAITPLHREDLPGYVMPTAIAAASFNANPVADLVVADRGAFPLLAGRAHTLLNDGTGTTWFATPLPFAVTEAIAGVAVGDVDGDDKVDLLIAEGSPSTGRLHYLRGNGIGFFAPDPASPLPAPANPGAVAVADYDADGDRDVLVAAADGALPLQRGALQVFANTAGTLQAEPAWPTDLGPSRLVATDLDADGFPGTARPELLVLGVAAGNIALHGAYEPSTGFVGGGLSTLVDGPVDMAASDLDGDNFGDLVVAEPARGGVALLFGSATARVTTFGRGCPGTAGREPRLETRGAPGMPTQPNATLQIGLADAVPLSLAVYALAMVPAPVLTPCGYLLDVTFATWVVVTDAAGRAAVNLPLAAMPDVHGLPLCLQAGVWDPAATASFFPGVSLTAGLRLRIGD